MTRRTLPPHCYQKPAGIYFQRRGCQTVRIVAAPGTAEFAAEYALALRGTPIIPTHARTFAALVISYRASPAWAALKPRTRSDYDKVLAWVTAKLGPLPVDRMRHKDVIRAQADNAATVRFANYIVQVLRILFGHAKTLGWREDNPATGVKALSSGRDRRTAWPQGMVDAYRATAPLGTRQRLLFELCIGTGQRIGDVLRMRWDDLSDGGIAVRQGKTGVRVWIPFTPHLQAALAATAKRGLTIAAQPNGRPTSYRGAADLVMAVRVKIGAEAFDLHSLRYTVVRELAEAGCSDDLIMSVTGHASREMVALYAGQARQKVRAIEAQGRRK